MGSEITPGPQRGPPCCLLASHCSGVFVSDGCRGSPVPHGPAPLLSRERPLGAVLFLCPAPVLGCAPACSE